MGNNLLSAKATLPVYDRNNLAPRIIHLGFGAFHRAHQGVYAELAHGAKATVAKYSVK